MTYLVSPSAARTYPSLPTCAEDLRSEEHLHGVSLREHAIDLLSFGPASSFFLRDVRNSYMTHMQTTSSFGFTVGQSVVSGLKLTIESKDLLAGIGEDMALK